MKHFGKCCHMGIRFLLWFGIHWSEILYVAQKIAQKTVEPQEVRVAPQTCKEFNQKFFCVNTHNNIDQYAKLSSIYHFES